MTDDWSGELHKQAKSNIISYANETCSGKKSPNACALYDPAGAIHYLLGQKYENDGALIIPVGKRNRNKGK